MLAAWRSLVLLLVPPRKRLAGSYREPRRFLSVLADPHAAYEVASLLRSLLFSPSTAAVRCCICCPLDRWLGLPGDFGMLPVAKALVLHLGPTLHAVWCCAGAMVLGGPAAAESCNCGNHSLTVDLVLGSLHESLSCGSCCVPAEDENPGSLVRIAWFA